MRGRQVILQLDVGRGGDVVVCVVLIDFLGGFGLNYVVCCAMVNENSVMYRKIDELL